MFHPEALRLGVFVHVGVLSIDSNWMYLIVSKKKSEEAFSWYENKRWMMCLETDKQVNVFCLVFIIYFFIYLSIYFI